MRDYKFDKQYQTWNKKMLAEKSRHLRYLHNISHNLPNEYYANRQNKHHWVSAQTSIL